MSKRKSLQQKSNKRVEEVTPPYISWEETAQGWVPTIYIANIAMPLEARSFQGWFKGERDAVMVYITQCLSEVLFDIPKYLVSPSGKKTVVNPDWERQPYWESLNEEKYHEVTPPPTMTQEQAAKELPVST